jgi:hypothetical protein
MMVDNPLNGIDISNIPDFDMAPVQAYSDVMPDEEDFEVNLFDVGVGFADTNDYEHEVAADLKEAEPVRRAPEVLAKAPHPRRKPKSQDVPATEELEQFIQLPESIKDTVIGRYSTSVARAIEFPETSAFMVFLACASASVACNYAVQFKFGDSLPTGLYVIVEQPPSTQKSRILGAALNSYLISMGKHNRIVFGKLREAKEGNPEISDWLRPGFLSTTDATTAAMDKAMAGLSEGRFVIATDEKSILSSLFPPPTSFASSNDIVLKGYTGDRVASMRSGRLAFSGKANGTVVINAQGGAAARILRESDGSGMAERFFFVSEPSYLGTRTFDEQPIDLELKKAYDNAAIGCVQAYSKQILKNAMAEEQARVTLDPENLEQLRLTAAGYEKIRTYRRENEPLMAELERAGEMVMLSWLGKFEAHVIKIAAVLHVYECIGNGSKVSGVITDRILVAAMELVDLMADHQQQMIRDSGDSGNDAEEQVVIEALGSSRMALRSLLQKIRYRKPFSSMGKNGYSAAKRRVETMISAGVIVVNASGSLEVV